MTLQERIDYLTNISETIVGQLNELIALNHQIQRARAVPSSTSPPRKFDETDALGPQGFTWDNAPRIEA
jgi:hypothetical protein